MSRKSFGLLLQKYLRGECTPEEKSVVEHWYGLLEAETGESVDNTDMQELEEQLWSRIQSKKESENVQNTVVINRWGWIGIAASLLLVGGWYFTDLFGTKLWGTPSVAITEKSGWVEQYNTSDKPLLIKLEEGSTVQLSPQSTLRYPRKFASDNRVVFLKGDGFFNIQKQPERPFLVHTNNIITKVLGTSFFIRTEAETQKVRVEVVTGRVAVYEDSNEKKLSEANGVVLTPNQMATYFKEQQHFVTGLVENPVVLPTAVIEKKETSMRFDDVPLEEVLSQIEKFYGIEIIVENEQLNRCPLTADLTNQPLYTQLDLICAALRAKYDVRGTTILINGKGCE